MWYTECLRELGIWLSPEWLHRKVCYQRRRFSALRALGKLLPWRKVKLPSLGNTWSSPREWVKTFRKLNPGFCALLEAIREEIETGLREAYTKYYANYEDLANPEKNMVRSRFRFYTYRASILITPGLEKILQSLVLHPWLCNLAVLRAYPSVLAETARSFRNLSPYLRSAVLWAIGETRDPGFSDFLVQALFDRNSSLVVKLMASQALLKIGDRVKLDRSQLEREIEAALSKEQTFLLKNLILLWGMFWKEAGKNKLFEEVGKKCADFPEHERWLVEQALANVTRGAEIVSSLDTIPDWLLPEEYPEYEDIPEFTPIS